MFRVIWKIVLVIIILYVLSLIIRDSHGFDWNNFDYSTGDKKSDVVNIGFVSSLSGPSSLVGIKSLSAAKLAIDEINSNGGVNGKPVRLLVEDGKCSVTGGFNATEKLLRKNVVGIVGGLCSNESLGMIDLIDINEIPTISHCSSSAELSGVSKYFFRVYPSDSQQVVFAAHYINENLNAKKIGVVFIDTNWGVEMKKSFSHALGLDMSNIFIEEYPFTRGDDFSSIFSDLRRSGVDLVYFIGFDVDTISAFSVIKESDNFIMFGTYLWDDDNIWDNIDYRGSGKIMYTVIDYSEYNKGFIEKIRKRGIHSIYSCIPQAYDAVKILVNAINDSNDEKSIIENISNTRYLGGASKEEIQFDENGDILDVSYSVKEIFK